YGRSGCRAFSTRSNAVFTPAVSVMSLEYPIYNASPTSQFLFQLSRAFDTHRPGPQLRNYAADRKLDVHLAASERRAENRAKVLEILLVVVAFRKRYLQRPGILRNRLGQRPYRRGH